MRRGAITEEDQNFVETWENVTPPTYTVVKLNLRGDEEQALIAGPRRFMITTEERLLTQAKILQASDDPFRNGAFRPITVPDSVTVETNPNALSDQEIGDILKSSDLAWAEWMKVIDSVSTLRRMKAIADNLADTGWDIKLSRYREIDTRLQAAPRPRVVQKDQDQYESIRGGRSESYRQPVAS